MKKFGFIAGMVLVVMIAAGRVRAADYGQFTELEGTVLVQSPGAAAVKAALGTMVKEGDRVVTKGNGRATILFQDGSVIRLGPSSSLEIKRLEQEEEKGIVQSLYHLAAGTMMSIVGSLFGREGSDYQVTTPTSTSGVRGTMFILQVGTDAQGFLTTTAVGLEGQVGFQGIRGGEQLIGPGMFSKTGPDGAAAPPAPVSEEMLKYLMDTVTVGGKSLGERRFTLRQRRSSEVPDALVPMEITLLPEGEGEDDSFLAPYTSPPADNPSDLIYQEPPQLVELILTVNIP